jgi:transcriptional regulator with XRE-family HTH domain
MTIGERIRIARQNKKISQQELSDKSGVAYKSLSRYELGSTVPPADALKAIADALGVSADFLLSDDTIQIKDKDLFKKFEVIQEMRGDTKNTIMNLLDLAIRDYKAKQAFGIQNV